MSEQSAGADNSADGSTDRGTAGLVRTYLEALRAADAAGAFRVASRALAEGMPLAGLYQQVITPAMRELGGLWEKGAITIADEHLATALTNRVLAALRPPALFEQAVEGDVTRPRAMLAAVQGEQHVLGLRMAADLLEDAGYQTLYLGADVPPEALLRAIESLSPNLLGLSATMPASGVTLERVAIDVRGAHPELGLVVGGQAVASHPVQGATAVDDLERLEEQVRLL